MQISFAAFSPIGAGSYLELADAPNAASTLLTNINTKNDDRCFLYCFVASYQNVNMPALYPTSRRWLEKNNCQINVFRQANFSCLLKIPILPRCFSSSIKTLFIFQCNSRYKIIFLHCPYINKFLGWTHNECNVNINTTNYIPVVAHNLTNFESDFIIKALTKIDSENTFSGSLGDYHNMYLTTDVILLASVFEAFCEVCYQTYGLDCACYFTASNLSGAPF